MKRSRPIKLTDTYYIMRRNQPFDAKYFPFQIKKSSQLFFSNFKFQIPNSKLIFPENVAGETNTLSTTRASKLTSPYHRTICTMSHHVETRRDDRSFLSADMASPHGFGSNFSLAASISRHAFAHECNVIGIQESSNEEHETTGFVSNTDNFDQTKWETSFYPHQVQEVVSTDDGLVIAATTDDGSISLLNGMNGSLISTRKLAENHSDPGVNASFSFSTSTPPSTKLHFIRSSYNHGNKDALLIFQSTSSDPEDTYNSPTSHCYPSVQSNAIIVSGIDTSLLTSCNPKTLQFAARSMSIDILNFKTNTESDENDEEVGNHVIQSDHIGALNGTFIAINIIRFLACCTEGRLSSYDYSITEKEVISEFSHDVLHDLCFDYEAGIKVDTNCEVSDLFIVTHSSESKKIVSWISASSLEILSEYILPHSNNEHSTILVLEAIQTCCAQSAVAVAVAFQQTSDQSYVRILIIQAIVSRNDILDVQEIHDYKSSPSKSEHKEFTMIKPHLIYSIPVYQGTALNFDNVSIAPMCEKYSFKYAIAHGASQECKEFLTSKTGPQVGKFRMLLAQGLFDEADGLLSYAPNLSDNFETIHSSEVALWRLRDLLSHSNVSSPDNILTAKECLRRLAVGAVTGGDVGIRCLLSASKSVSSWPVSQENNSKEIPFIEEFSLALSVMGKTLANASESVAQNHVLVLEDEKRKFDLQIRTVHILEEILCNDSNKSKLTINLPYSSTSTPIELYHLLISLANFAGAERVRRLEWGRTITIYEVAQSVSFIPKTVNPLLYCNWLQNFVISGLSVNHPSLNMIRSWACQAADEFDKNSQGLNLSIILLKAVVNGTAKLFAKTFASHSLAGEETRLTNIANQSSYLDDSKSSLSQSISSNNPISPQNQQASNMSVSDPTLLQFFRYSKPERISQMNSSFSAINNLTYDENDCETKLQNALELEKGRSIGLSKDTLSLKNYSTNGGATFVACELVKIISSKFTDVNVLNKHINGTLKLFCNFSAVDLDESIDNYTQTLCENEITPESISELVLLARCSSEQNNKCKLALKALRAGLSSYNLPKSLFLFSKEALNWAADEITKSELEEASRLLTLDKLVRKYCGNEARELFQASNPRHATNLMRYICEFIDDPYLMIEVYELCNGFFHLSKVDSCVRIIHNIILAPEIDQKKIRNPGLFLPFSSQISTYTSRLEQISLILTQSFQTNASLALEVGSRIIINCSQMLKECTTLSSPKRSIDSFRYAKAASSSAVCVLTVILENCSMREWKLDPSFEYFSKLGIISWPLLLRDFQRVLALQQEFKVFLSLSELHEDDARMQVAEKCLAPVFNLLLTKEVLCEITLLSDLLAKAKRGIFLLYAEVTEDKNAWFEVTGQILCNSNLLSNDEACFTLLKCIGLLDAIKSEAASRVLVNISKALFLRSIEVVHDIILSSNHGGMGWDSSSLTVLSAMKCIVKASFLLGQHALISCSCLALESVVNQSCAMSIAVQILTRTDCGISEMIDSFIRDVTLQDLKCRDPFLTSDTISKHRKVNESKDSIILHQNWYIGDGLLIPPLESICYGIELFLMVADISEENSIQMSTLVEARKAFPEDIFSFLSIRGAHALALRVKYFSLAKNFEESDDDNNRQFLFSSITEHYASIDTMQCLAERSLGESNGITCGIVDHSLAIAYLLLLPPDNAVKVFSSALTGAMSRRDFSRVFTIANVGASAGRLWKGQIEFMKKCERLAINSFWWRTFVYHNAEDFSISQFCESVPIQDDEDMLSSYSTQSLDSNKASLLVSLLIECSSKKMKDCDSLFSVANKFSMAFSVQKNLIHRKLTEFFLLQPQQQLGHSKKSNIPLDDAEDIRNNLALCKKGAQKGLSLIASFASKLKVLRKCVLSSEHSNSCGQEYERYNLVLTMYQIELTRTIKENQHKENFDLDALYEELDKIERRLDAIALLSSYFAKEKINSRPNYRNLFLPLTQIGIDREKNSIKLCGVIPLPRESANVFDPLASLSSTLINEEAATALAPLCSSLGLPQGYVHARTLYNRFMAMKENGAVLSFELNVNPVLKRLQKSSDCSLFAEWCAFQYDKASEERLKCLEYAHALAIKASNEAEHRKKSCPLEEERKSARRERRALDNVIRIEISRSSLADKIEIENLLRKKVETSDALPFKKVLQSIIDSVMKSSLENLMTPENFVQMLLCESSNIAARSCLDENLGFTMDHFRDVAYIIHEGCHRLAEQHSHVHVGLCAKSLARQWMTFGDDTNVQERKVHVSHIDERSIFTCKGSSRERSEYFFSKEILRITFVISFASGYFDTDCDKDEDTENIVNDSTFSFSSKCEKTSILSAPLSRDNSTKQKFKSAFEHAHELLSIAFATSEMSMKRLDLHKTRNAITFAMRYRALRVASLLCPLEILMKVIKEEEFFRGRSCSMHACLFGSFVAMEIESMGLTLPHSDLIQLTVMNFPSYARTLWKYHGLNECKGFKARLMYLLLELCLKECTYSDVPLTIMVLDEISKLKENPRTMLASCELIASAAGKVVFFDKFLNDGGRLIVLRIIENVTKIVSNEFRQKTLGKFTPECTSIARRLGRVLIDLTDVVVKQESILFVVTELVSTIEIWIKVDELSSGILYVVIELTNLLRDSEMRSNVLKSINADYSTKVLSEKSVIDKVECDTQFNSVSAAFGGLDISLGEDLINAISGRSYDKSD